VSKLLRSPWSDRNKNGYVSAITSSGIGKSGLGFKTWAPWNSDNLSKCLSPLMMCIAFPATAASRNLSSEGSSCKTGGRVGAKTISA